MYRSLLELDLLSPSAQRALADCNDMHRNLMRAFPDIEAAAVREETGMLYALMTVEGKPCIYVVSRMLPDWSAVKSVRLYKGQSPLCVDAVADRFAAGQKYMFRLYAAPTKKCKGEGKNSRRVSLDTAEERRAWMERQSDKYGFSLLACRETGERRVSGRRGGDRIEYRGVTFEGALEIKDPEQFRFCWESGIGPGKAYGLGLLMLKRG